MKRLIYIILFFILSLMGAIIFFQQEKIKLFLINQLVTSIESHVEAELTVSSISLQFPFIIVIDQIDFKKNHQRLMTFNSCQVSINPFSLLWKKPLIRHLKVDTVDIASIDFFKSSSQEASSIFNEAFSLDFSIAHLKISPSLIPIENCSLDFSNSIELNGTITFNDQKLGLDLDGTIGSSKLQGLIQMDHLGSLTGTRLSLKTPSFNLEKVAPLSFSLHRIQMECLLSGTISSPLAKVTLNATSGEINGYSFEKLNCQMNGENIHSNLVKGHLTCDCSLKNGSDDISLSSPFLIEKGSIHLKDFFSNLSDLVSCSGNLAIHLNPFSTFCHVKGHLNQTIIHAFTGLKSSKPLQWEFILNEQATQGDVLWKWEEIDQSDLHFSFSGSSKIDPSLKNLPFHFEWREVETKKLSVKGSGQCDFSPQKLTVQMEEMEGQLNSTPLLLKNPFLITFQSDCTQFSPFTISVGEGSFLGSCCLAKDLSSLHLSVRETPIALLNDFNIFLPLNGFVSAEIDLKETGEKIDGNAQLFISKIAFDDPAYHQYKDVEIHLTGSLNHEVATFGGSLTGITDQPFSCGLSVPMQLKLFPFKWKVKPEDPFNAYLHCKNSLEPLLELFYPEKKDLLSGVLDVKLQLKGSFDHPQLAGDILLTDGHFSIPSLGVTAQHLTLKGKIDEDQILISSIEATDGKQGKITGQAKIELVEHFPFSSAFSLEHLNVYFSPHFKGFLNGNIDLKGNRNQAILSGEVLSEGIEVIIPEKQKEVFPTIAITYINQKDDKPKPPVKDDASLGKKELPLELDLQITMQNQVMIQGKDFKSEWKGSFKMTGGADQPLYHGHCQLIKGQYMFNGTPFNLSQGTITFAGNYEKKTSLYVIAVKEFDSIKAEMIFKGPLGNPAISFRSNPPLPQREILSWILFNRGSSEISPFQGTQLNESISLLQCQNQSSDFLANFRQKIGIDRIEINRKSPESNEVSLQVGKYISRGVFVSVNKGITEEANKLGIEADLLRNVKLQAEVGDNSEGQLKLKWKKDY